MRKKTYIMPEAEAVDMQLLSMLCGSPVNEGNNVIDDDEYITDPGQLGAKGGFWNSDEE